MISQGKGVPYLIKAMKYLPDYNLTIAGNFINKETRKSVLSAINNSKSNIKTDFKWIDEEDKEKYYKKADCAVLPHTWAPYQSGILHNSVAWNLPVIVTKIGALYEMVELFKFGEIIKPKNPKALAEGIKTVFKNYSSYKKGIDRYKKAANWKNIAKQHFKLYSEYDI
jgi:glycosyltransferase involved in cell wall biosynthesis